MRDGKVKRKKIMFFIHDLAHGGAEKVLVNLVNNMDPTRFDITVMTLFDVGVNRQFLKPHIRYRSCFQRVFPGNSHVMKLFSPALLHRMLIKESYDIEIAYLEGTCARVISGCKSDSTKLVSWIHIELHGARSAAASFRSIREAKQCYANFDRIVSVSQTVQDMFQKALNVPVLHEVRYNTNESEQIRSLALCATTDVQFSAEEMNLVGVGKLLPNKGFDRLLRIAHRLREEGYPVHIYLLGIGPEKAKLETYAKEHGMESAVTFLGYQTNPYQYVAKCDLFVCSSLSEGFSTAATEALIVGTPVCTVEVAGMKEMLGENNEYGVVVPNEEEALYGGIKALLHDPDLLAHYKQKAKERGDTFRTANTVQAVEDMLLSL